MLHTTVPASKPSGSEEEVFFIKYFSMYFLDLNLGPLAWDHLGPWDLHFNKLDKGPLGNATCQSLST